MSSNKKQLEEEIQEKIRKVDAAMSKEGMPLTKEIKRKLYNCIIGKKRIEYSKYCFMEVF